MPNGTRNPGSDAPARLFYGWIVVGAAFGIMAIGFGAAYAFSAFFDSLQRDLGANRGEISLIFSIASFLYFGLGAISGPLADRWGPERVVAPFDGFNPAIRAIHDRRRLSPTASAPRGSV